MVDQATDAKSVIYSYIEGDGNMTDVVQSILCWMSEDQAVDWLYSTAFASDEEELRAALGDKDAQIIIDHYNAHCR